MTENVAIAHHFAASAALIRCRTGRCFEPTTNAE
jgi:hypothetical protein